MKECRLSHSPGPRLSALRRIGLPVLAVCVPALCGEIHDAARPFPLEDHPHGYLRAYEGLPQTRSAVALLGIRVWGQDVLQERLLEGIPHLPGYTGEVYLMQLDGRPLYTDATPRGQNGAPLLDKHWTNVSLVELMPGPHTLYVFLSGNNGAVPGNARVQFNAEAGHTYAILCATTGLYNAKGITQTKIEVGQHEGDPASVMYNPATGPSMRLSLSVVEAPASAEEACRKHTGFGGAGRRMCEGDIRMFLRSMDKAFESSRKP